MQANTVVLKLVDILVHVFCTINEWNHAKAYR